MFGGAVPSALSEKNLLVSLVMLHFVTSGAHDQDIMNVGGWCRWDDQQALAAREAILSTAASLLHTSHILQNNASPSKSEEPGHWKSEIKLCQLSAVFSIAWWKKSTQRELSEPESCGNDNAENGSSTVFTHFLEDCGSKHLWTSRSDSELEPQLSAQ